MTKNIQRRLTAILAADVVGYSRLMGEDEVGTLERLKTAREEVLEPLIAEHHGRIVKLMGDGLLAEFPSAVETPICAVAPRPSERHAALGRFGGCWKAVPVRCGQGEADHETRDHLHGRQR